ncbi:MAG: MurR/RpiR family transcriptional regulator [Bifidobacteriaceae bacterium]|nr:MurR/RpiR family transcriptional regulator [Bifidobacteriaceae bacterium]
MALDVLVAIRQAEPGMSPAEKRVASLVREQPARALSQTITELAESSRTSQATVLRFCRVLGYAGYPAFRIALARSISKAEVERERFSIERGEIDAEDSAEDVVAKLAFHEARTIEQTARFLDLDAVERIADALVAADRIEMYGVGSSGLSCLDLQQKLNRIGLVSLSYADPHLALTGAALLTPQSIAIAISYSGSTVETNHALEVAKNAGATTVAITNYPDSPLAATAREVLVTMSEETQFRSGAMSSRMAQLTVIDVLFVRTAQRVFAKATTSLRLTHDAVQSHRIKSGGQPAFEPRPEPSGG